MNRYLKGGLLGLGFAAAGLSGGAVAFFPEATMHFTHTAYHDLAGTPYCQEFTPTNPGSRSGRQGMGTATSSFSVEVTGYVDHPMLGSRSLDLLNGGSRSCRLKATV